MATPVGDSYSVSSGGVITAGRYAASAFWRNLPSGWTELTFSGSPPLAGMFAFSGMALDSPGGKCYFVGGGHNDSVYSGVMVADIESFTYYEEMPSFFTSSPTVSEARAVIDNYAYPGAILQGGVPYQPISRHTYHSVQWVEAIDGFTVAGGSTYSGAGEYLWYDEVVQPSGAWWGGPDDLWIYSPSSHSYSYKGSAKTNLTNYYGSRSIAHPTESIVYSFKPDSNNWLQCFAINPSNGSTTPRTGRASDDSAGAYAMTFDPTGRYIYILAQKFYGTGVMRLLRYDTQTDVYVVMPVNGGTLPAFTYDEIFTISLSTKTGKIYAISRADTPLKVYDPATGVWSDQSITSLTGFGQSSGRFAYDKKRDAFLLFFSNAGTVKAYAFRE